MSYCRWSSDDFSCDVYCYEDVSGGFTTHVALRRVLGEVQKLKPIDDPGFLESYRAQMDFMETAERKDIGLPHDGETFNDSTLADMRDRLKHLMEVGYNVPNWVFKNIDEELMEASLPSYGEKESK